MENKLMKFRLSLLMFLQVAVTGIISPVMSLYLIKTLGFSKNQAGVILSIGGITSFIAPIIGLLIVDNLIEVRRLLRLCHFIAAGFMLLLSYQTNFKAVLIVYFLYMLTIGSTPGFSSSIIFQQDPNPKKNFGFIRMWGSIGWILPGWFFSYIWLNNVNEAIVIDRLADILILASLASIVLGLYTYTLPKSRVAIDKKKSILPKDAFKLLKNKQILLVLAGILLFSISYQFYIFGMAPFLEQSGYKVSSIMPIMSLAQVVEVVGLAILGGLLIRKSYKQVMITGIIFNLIRYLSLALGRSYPFVLLGVMGHGLSFAFFSNAAQIYLDSRCDINTRSDMQQIISIVSTGLGAFLGHQLAGMVGQQLANNLTGKINYSAFWAVPVVINVILFMLITLFFREGLKEKDKKLEG